MNKSVIIIISMLWLICTLYYAVARVNHYPYTAQAMVGAWIASGLLLVCIIIYIRKHRSTK